MTDPETRQFLQRKMSENLQEAAKMAYVLNMDAPTFSDKAITEFKLATAGTIAPTAPGVIAIPARVMGKKGPKKLFCPDCGTWTDKIEVDVSTGEKIHGGRKGCGCKLTIPEGTTPPK
jgi:hypothetical protein